MVFPSQNQSLTPAEFALVADGELFRAKERIILKVQVLLAALQAGLQDDLARMTLLAPPGFDQTKAQSVKGERLEACPYQYLDYPKHFLGDEKFTFRSLCWWGHHLVFAMIIEGGQVKQCKKNFFDRFHQLAGQGLELSLAPTLWEWKRGRATPCRSRTIGRLSWPPCCLDEPGSRSPDLCRWIRRPCARAVSRRSDGRPFEASSSLAPDPPDVLIPTRQGSIGPAANFPAEPGPSCLLSGCELGRLGPF